MTDRRFRLRPLRRLIPVAFVAMVAVATVAGLGIPGPAPLEHPAATELHATLAEIERDRVLVAFDADLGTYAEMRPAVRAALAQLIRGGATLSFVSFTAEGRALGVAELDRLRRGGMEEGRLLDLGFRTGAEAGLVASIASLVPPTATGALADALRAAGPGIAAFDAVLIIGGGEMGPRSWVEQVATRVPDVPLVAIVPTSLQPQSIPYRATGQLAGLVAGTREGAAYVVAVRDDPTATVARAAEEITDGPQSAIPVLAGILLTVLLLAEAVASRWREALRSTA
jgi:hypothetical protein